ncbi:hypothetical protein Pelo_17469 [Pelomyxa schiedti]|nr:hypothetical protein Pelo_17469 [Pelomyxa schiedti]
MCLTPSRDRITERNGHLYVRFYSQDHAEINTKTTWRNSKVVFTVTPSPEFRTLHNVPVKHYKDEDLEPKAPQKKRARTSPSAPLVSAKCGSTAPQKPTKEDEKVKKVNQGDLSVTTTIPVEHHPEKDMYGVVEEEADLQRINAQLECAVKKLEQRDREAKSWVEQRRKELNSEALKTYTSLKTAQKAVHEFQALEETLKKEATVKVSNLKRCTLHVQDLEDGTATGATTTTTVPQEHEHRHPEAAMMDGNEEEESSGLLSQLKPDIEAVKQSQSKELQRINAQLECTVTKVREKYAFIMR